MQSYIKMNKYFRILLFFGIVLGQENLGFDNNTSKSKQVNNNTIIEDSPKTSFIVEGESNKKSSIVFIADVLTAYGGFLLASGLIYNPPTEGASYTVKEKEFIDWYDDEYESANSNAKLGATLLGVAGVIKVLDYVYLKTKPKVTNNWSLIRTEGQFYGFDKTWHFKIINLQCK